MNRYARVLAAIDFSKPARGAFDHALALSRQHGAELVVVHAVPLDQAFDWRGRDRQTLIETLRQRAADAGVAFADRVQHGDPADVILLHAQALGADVIVAGTHQRRGLDRLSAASVAGRIAAKAAVPVLVVPPRRQAGTRRPFRHVAVAVDFSDASAAVIDQALALTHDADDRVTLLHVVPGFTPGVSPHLHRYGIGEYQNHLMIDAQRRLRQAVPADPRSPAAIHTRVLLGDTTAELNRLDDGIGADVMVVGVPARGVLSRAVFGTTADRLLRVTGVPLLAVPDSGATRTRGVAVAA